MSLTKPARNANTGKHDLDAHKLESDVRHGCENASDRDRECERLTVKSATHKIRRGNITVPLSDRPKAGKNDEHEGINDYGVRKRKEANRARAKDECRYGDERVGRIKVTTEEKPGDKRT